MTILALYPVNNDLGWGREDFENMPHNDAFNVLWWNRYRLGARFYNVESFTEDDIYELSQYIGNADDFETDYNDEELDGGWWCKALLIPSDKVKEIIGIKEQ